ncbi:hypothetical protein P3S68_013430 [Capsicum galapagoense]
MWLKKVFLIFATLFYHFSLVGGCYEGERAALMRFKSFMTDPSSRLSSWKGDNCCNWKGIKCSSSGHVVLLNLRNPHPDEVMINVNKEVVSSSKNTSDFALKEFHTWLEGLQNLRYLVMIGVDLSKASESFHWAKPVSNLSNLILLQLSNCNISERIPIGQLLNVTCLSVLDMRSNILTSTIPDMLSNLTTLSALDFSANDLDSHIPYLPQLKELYVSGNPAMTVNLVSMFSASWSKLKFLDISFTHVGGTLPPSLTNLTSLTFFQADGCLRSIPSSVTKLTKLRRLMLNDNNITGQLPVSMSSLISLQYLSLIQNGLRGYIPTSICQILSLEYLNVEWNELTGSVPSCILQLPKFSYLSVQTNNLNGINGFMRREIPEFFSNLMSLVVLFLANNSLSGAIPYWLFNLPALSVLDLSMNNFEGVIPPLIQMKSSLFSSIVNLARNKIEGPIPTQLENVNVIDLSLNNFVGSIPAQMGEIPAIRSISLSKNKIHGPIPESFFQSINVLQVLDLSNNSLSCTVPLSLGNCKSLIYLNLGQNKLTGSVPEELEHVTSLRYLDLNGKEFEGSFPTVIEKFQELEILNLAGNRFKGRIPKFIGDLYHLRILVLASNSFNESIPEGVMKLENLQFISLSRNKLPEIVTKGQTRFHVSVYSYNTGFDVSSNALSSKITEKIGLLNGIPLLNLSHNNLTGLIPQTMGEMISLESLDLSYNQLTCEIPVTFVEFSRFDTLYQDGTVYVGKKYLCGTPDGMNCSNNYRPSTNETKENKYDQENVLFVLVIFSSFVTGISGVFLLLYLIDDNWTNKY